MSKNKDSKNKEDEMRIRATTSFKEKVKKHAAEIGLDLSNYVRMLITKDLKN